MDSALSAENPRPRAPVIPDLLPEIDEQVLPEISKLAA